MIKIHGNYESYELYDKEKYSVSNKLLIKCDENTWDSYFKFIKINNNQENSDKLSEDEDILSSESNDENENYELENNENNSEEILYGIHAEKIIRSKSI